MATRKSKPPAAGAGKQDVSSAPHRDDVLKLTVKRKRRRLYDPVPDLETAPPEAPAAAEATAVAVETPATAAPKPPAKARKRPAKARRARAKVAPKKPTATKTLARSGAEHASPAAGDRAARNESAQILVKKYSLGTAAVGLVPLPLVDLVAFSLLQGKMLKDLAELYEVEYSEQRARIFTSALVGSFASISVARQTGVLLGSLLKSVPAIGLVTGAALMPAASGASTYALGKVFIQHFESGGTLLDFDAEKMRAYYELQIAETQEPARS